jgi:ribosomal protein L12E/L44/L45/RPP1/RPP2
MSKERNPEETTRRDVLQKALFVAPAVLTLAAVPSIASAGSGKDDKEEKEEKEKKEKKEK